MNMKKITIITVSLLLAGASAFAWSKKSDSLGNLGRTYVSISGAVNVSKYKSSGVTDSPTGAQGSAVINAPILKPASTPSATSSGRASTVIYFSITIIAAKSAA